MSIRKLCLFSLFPFCLFGQDVDFREVFERSGCMVGKNLEELVKDEVEVYIFVSFSLPQKLLSQYVKEAKENGASLVVKGLPKRGFNAFLKQVDKYREGEEIPPFELRPDLFEEFFIEQVPAIVFRKGKVFDKITGSVSLDFVKERIRERGEVSFDDEEMGRLG